MIPTMLHFIGIGAQKAATSWLHRQMGRCPDISFPAGKEVHFWDKYRDRGIEWYSSRFAVDDGTLHGEITPAYSTLPSEIIAECHRHFPDLRLLLTIRNPIDRAWSAAKMRAIRTGQAVADTPDSWFLSHFNDPHSTARGDYETCIRTWRGSYPADQLLVQRFEALLHDPMHYLERCIRHVGATSTPAVVLADLREPVMAGDPTPLRAPLQEHLRGLYRDKILSLSDYLGEDLRGWLEPSPP